MGGVQAREGLPTGPEQNREAQNGPDGARTPRPTYFWAGWLGRIATDPEMSAAHTLFSFWEKRCCFFVAFFSPVLGGGASHRVPNRGDRVCEGLP